MLFRPIVAAEPALRLVAGMSCLTGKVLCWLASVPPSAATCGRA